MTRDSAGKVSPRLVEQLESTEPAGLVEVVVELEPKSVPPGQSRASRMAAMRQDFEREAAPVSRRIEAAGGQVLGSAWINQTIRGRIPAGEVLEVAEEASVRAIDLPAALEPD